jgi:hypothetical protein
MLRNHPRTLAVMHAGSRLSGPSAPTPAYAGRPTNFQSRVRSPIKDKPRFADEKSIMKTHKVTSAIITPSLVLSLLFATGCQSIHNIPSSQSGNWVATLSTPGTSSAFQNQATFGMSGYYESATGKALLNGFPCASPSAPVAVTGTQDLLSLDTTWVAPINQDSTLTILGQQSQNFSSMNGTFSLTGTHCGGLTSGTFTATNYSPITGEFLGSVVTTQGNSISVLATLEQADAVDQTGKYSISGSGSLTPSQCVNNPTLVNSYVVGNTFSLSYLSADQSQLNITGTFTADAKTLNLQSFAITGGSCDGLQGSGKLTKD